MTAKPTYAELELRIEALEKKLAGYEGRNAHCHQFGLTHQYLEAILNNTNLPIYLKDAEYRYILVNRQYELLARVSNEQIQGLDDYAIFPEPVATLFRNQDEQVVRQRNLLEFEETIPLPDGVHTFLTAKFPIVDSDGRVIAVGGVCTDITSQKQAEALFRRTFDQAPIGAAIADRDFRFMRVNEEFCRMTGYSVEELLKLGFPDITHAEELDKDVQYARKLTGGEIDQYQTNKRYVRKDGKVIWVRLSVRLLRDEDGTPLFYLPMMEDIHERIRAEEELREAHDKLEKRVAERTALLNQRTERLAETNVALKVLLEKREDDKIEMQERVMFNIEKLIKPHLKKLRSNCESSAQNALLSVIETNLDDIAASFGNHQNDGFAVLTPAQIQIADLIKQGQTTKEIAAILNLSPATIACHRQEIRKRLSLTNRKINLRAALSVLD